MSPEAPSELTHPAVVVDTDVVSYLFKGDSRAASYHTHLIGRVAVVSFMTVAELDAWAELRNWGTQRRELLEAYLKRYAIHFPSRELCALWGVVTARARQSGAPISAADAWIAATALLYDVPLITHNPGDYRGVPNLTLWVGADP
jgi:tRNA(fMet)-specific endonuclease VapC